MYRPRASEFPNDNPLLHDGAIWVCSLPCGPLESVPFIEPPVAVVVVEPFEETFVDVATEDAPVDAGESEPITTTLLPPPPEGFAAFVQALVSIALAAGATRVAMALPDLVEHGHLEPDAVDADTVSALLATELVRRTDQGLGASERLCSLVRAWRGVLDSGDFSACGDETLIEWAADLLAAMLGAPQNAQAMQYQLRRHGVAAFGLVKLAA